MIQGSNHADVIAGGAGDDRISGMGGNDVIDGRAGQDQIFAENMGCSFSGCGDVPADDDIIRGGDGNDMLVGANGRDVIEGGDGDDLLTAPSAHGPASMAAGPGDDSVVLPVRNGMDAVVDGGPGSDHLQAHADDLVPGDNRVTVDASRGTLSANAIDAVASLAGFEVYDLDATFDTDTHQLDFLFLGSASAERVRAAGYSWFTLHARMRGGDDVVRATRRDDVIAGGSGFDRVWAHGGHDRCRGVEETHGCEVHR